jgi:hypothetical protein
MTECPIECISRDLICESPPDFLEKHGSFFLTLFGVLTGVVGLVFTYFLKSRCTEIKCFGLFCKRRPIDLDIADVEITSATIN